MIRLDPANVEWLFVHTASFQGNAGVVKIREWHTSPPRNWDTVGYHFVIRRNGDLEVGRSLEYAGAQVGGVNSKSIGVCCEGHGDYEPFTPEQLGTLADLRADLVTDFPNLKVENVLGHREVNGLVDRGLVEDYYRTTKTCPGLKVDMNEVRQSMLPPTDREPGWEWWLRSTDWKKIFPWV